MKVTRTFEWDSAHRITRHTSKCRFIHGHRYKAEVEVETEELDGLGMVVDFGVIKAKVGAWIDEHWDHNTLANDSDLPLIECAQFFDREPFTFHGEPTVENITRELWAQSKVLLEDHRLAVTRVRVYETPNCFAEWRA